jgi:putative drug exporter of the RND superfamily
VVRGLASTGRVITSAAAIMMAVFVGFALDPDVTVKTLAEGMAVAVLIDATIVRDGAGTGHDGADRPDVNTTAL